MSSTKKWYVLRLVYKGMDGKQRIASSEPSDDFDELSRQQREYMNIGYQALVEECSPPVVKKKLTGRKIRDLTALLFDPELVNRKKDKDYF